MCFIACKTNRESMVFKTLEVVKSIVLRNSLACYRKEKPITILSGSVRFRKSTILCFFYYLDETLYFANTNY